MNKELSEQTGSSSAPKRKTISAREFLAAFKENPDDVHLLQKFGLTPEQLETTYSVLIEKGLLSEYEYNYRERKLPELQGKAHALPAASDVAKMVESPSEALAEMTLNSGFQLDPLVAKALEEWKARKQPRKRPTAVEEPKVELCPKCRKPKEPSSPDSCLYCGVVYAKVTAEDKKKGVLIWRDD